MSAIGERIRDKMEDWGLDKYLGGRGGGGGGSGGADSSQRTKVIIAVVALTLAAVVIGWQLFPSGAGGGSARSVSTPTINWVDTARQKLYEAGLADKRLSRVALDVVGDAKGKEEVLIYGDIPNAAAEASVKEFVGTLSPPFSVRYDLKIDGQPRK